MNNEVQLHCYFKVRCTPDERAKRLIAAGVILLITPIIIWVLIAYRQQIGWFAWVLLAMTPLALLGAYAYACEALREFHVKENDIRYKSLFARKEFTYEDITHVTLWYERSGAAMMVSTAAVLVDVFKGVTMHFEDNSKITALKHMKNYDDLIENFMQLKIAGTEDIVGRDKFRI